MAKSKMRRVPRKRRAGLRKRRVGKARASNVRDFASLSVSRTFTVPGSPPTQPIANVMYSMMATQLTQYTRAVQAAQAYQYYRIKRVSLKLKPQFDTYASSANAYGKPKLYYIIDKSGALPTNVSLESLKQMGARPRNLDEKALTISFSPTVLNSAMTAGGGAFTTAPSQYQVTPWLNTNANTVAPGVWTANDVDHLGCYWYVESTSYGGTGGLPYQVDVEVQFEFKKPLWSALSSTTAIELVPAILDASPDGVEGGSDGITIPLIH
ncbi:putative cap protein [Garrulus glandarius associated circular virus 1]|uniref:putative cap protein n=1 Tax=Garrulus glandarius associated circular virus 1 TaxID=2006642 RepID=UPI000B5B7A3D|nr:putative cap protein [Garrulus glandarius associated circular virus 1]ARV76502.1 putative cap protein [Garrulus glandarius associated circular virus 1]AZQ25386.1 putative cap [Garrulus glandarius associated circular virus 1]